MADKKDEIISMQLDLIRKMTENNIRRISDDLWGPTHPNGEPKPNGSRPSGRTGNPNPADPKIPPFPNAGQNPGSQNGAGDSAKDDRDLIKASDGVIADNVLEGVEGYAIQISPEYEWMEGGCSRNLKVTDNVFLRSGGGVLLAGNNGARRPLPADSHRDIAITGNRIGDCWSGIDVVGCTGLDLRGNDIRLRPDSKKQPVNLTNVAAVTR